MLQLRNEFLMPPIKLGYSDGTGVVTQKHIDFYNDRAKDIGAITLEPLFMDSRLRELPTQLGIHHDDMIDGLKKITQVIHQAGAKAIAHLNHPGRIANPKIPNNIYWSSTDQACENGGAKPVKMDGAMMDEVIQIHLDAINRAEKADFDIIEIQFGHGYLMAQFMSPMVNDRTNEFGGSLENRMKFPLEVAKAVRTQTKLPLIARVSADEMIPQGLHLDEVSIFAKELEKIGFEAIHVSAGSACSTPPWFFQHMFTPKGKTWEMAHKLQEHLSIPVIYVGQVNEKNDIDFLKNELHAPLIAVGRAMVADPKFIGKYLNNNPLYKPCLACAEGCLGGVKSGKGLGCVVNPLVNTSLKEPLGDVPTKRYAVVGGGLAGMQAALVLRDRGHDVDLYEKNELGGQFNLAYLPPNKASLKKLVDYFIEDVKTHSSHQINLIHKEATAKDLTTWKYEAIIMATGAIPTTAPIKGLNKYYWTEFLDDQYLPVNEKVLVIGGGLIGLEVASKLVDANNEVIVVEMLNELAKGMEMIEKAMTMKKLQSKKAILIASHKVVEVEESKVTLEGPEGKKILEGIDKIVMTTGMKSYRPFEKIDEIPIHFIGDARQVSKAQEAIHDAYELAMSI